MKNTILTYLFFASLWFVTSCVTEPMTSSIPYSYVSFELDVSTGGVHSHLRRDMLGNALFFNVQNPSVLSSVSSSGYGFGGVFVVRGMNNDLYAFVAACPYEHSADVSLEHDGYFLICPVCKTQYDVAEGWGMPNIKSGPGNERLKKYRVFRINDERFRISN